MTDEHEIKPVPLAEVKNILTKISKDRKEMLYEQKTALEHAQKFSKLSVKKTEELIKELNTIEIINEIHAYKIADILPKNIDDLKAIFAKERISLGEAEGKKILEIVSKYNL